MHVRRPYSRMLLGFASVVRSQSIRDKDKTEIKEDRYSGKHL